MHTSGISVNLVYAENVPTVWLIVKDKLKKGLEELEFRTYEIGDIYDSLLTKKAQLWIVNDSEMNILLVGITRVYQYPKEKRVLIDLLVGKNLKLAYHTLEKIQKWAALQGAKRIEAYCLPWLADALERRVNAKRGSVIMLWDVENVDLPEAQR